MHIAHSGSALEAKVASGSLGLLPKLTLHPVHKNTLVLLNVATQQGAELLVLPQHLW